MARGETQASKLVIQIIAIVFVVTCVALYATCSHSGGTGTTAATRQAADPSYTAHEWSFDEYPLYYAVRGTANVEEDVEEGQTIDEGLDSLGRTQAVRAKVTYDMVKKSAGWREEMTAECSKISGWGHNKRVTVELSNGRSYTGAAFNRSHLLADSLGGHAKRENLVTGTRTQNVGNNVEDEPGGMQYTEIKAAKYLKKHHKGWIYYKATPVYEGDELVCRSVYVDIKSDDGSIDEHVEVFNAINGYTVDYTTGKISKG